MRPFRSGLAIIALVVLPSITVTLFAYAARNMHPARFWEKVRGAVVQCQLCPRRCVLDVNQRGVCTARINKGGALYSLGYGSPVALNVDPIEKKPFFHVMPGARAYSIAVPGCNMRCLFCQNWQISQSRPDETDVPYATPDDIVRGAVDNKCAFIVYTYTEPTVFYEYMLDIAKDARAHGIRNGMHTCGYINTEPLKELLRYMDAVNVDLKGFNESFYNKMGMMAELKPVLETIKTIKREGVWLEITNLIIPGQNDDSEDIRKMCVWIKDNVGDEVPLHFSRFTPAFRLQNLPPTPTEKLVDAYRIAREVGLKYVYIGNVPGRETENTYCPKCGKMVIGRTGYMVTGYHLNNGACSYCGNPIAGIWNDR